MKMQTRAGAQQPGFSLLELTLVLAIIGVLMAVVAVNVMGGSKRANIRATEASLSTIGQALDTYALDNASTYPATLETLVQAEYLKEGAVLDAWKEPFWYQAVRTSQGRPFALQSAGPDKQHGTDDDINYWDIRARN